MTADVLFLPDGIFAKLPFFAKKQDGPPTNSLVNKKNSKFAKEIRTFICQAKNREYMFLCRLKRDSFYKHEVSNVF